MDTIIKTITSGFSKLSEVDAVVLAGSRTTESYDTSSDYDFYIYRNSIIDRPLREAIYSSISKKIELDNNYWEDEDNLILHNGTAVDIIYRDINWFESELDRVVFKYQASVGYTTCLWSNLLNSKILYDRDGLFKKLKSKYSVNYPVELQKNIIEKNIPIISHVIPSLVFQVEKAIERGDLISVNHRISEYLAAYFDILFAKNRVAHPGEKRLIERAKKLCSLLPKDFDKDIIDLLKNSDNRVNRLKEITNSILSI